MNQLLAVFFYEWRRTLTFARMAWWLVLSAFPAALVLLIRFQGEFGNQMSQQQVDTVWSILLYMLIPCVCCAMGVFLNAAPAVAGELEQRSWIYLATRPRGIFWLLIGKYLVAVAWSVSSSLVAVSLAVGATEAGLEFAGVTPPVLRVDQWRRPPQQDMPPLSQGTLAAGGTAASSGPPGRLEVLSNLWFTMARLSVLSSVAYAALYLLIGSLFPRRAMVFCVFYTVLVEVILSLIPAIINRLTIQYRLRSLMMNWAEPHGRDQLQNNIFFRYVFAEGSNAEQIAWLSGLSLLFLSVAILAAHLREFTSASESDV